MSKLKFDQKIFVPITSIEEIQKYFPSEKSCIDFLEYIRWNNIPQSPFDKNSIIYKCSNAKYRCRKTKKYFTVKTNTIFDGTKIQLQYWFIALIIFIQNEQDIVRSRKIISPEFNITGRTAWLMLNKIRYAINHAKFIEKFSLVQEKNKKITLNQLLQCLMSVPRKKSVLKKQVAVQATTKKLLFNY